MYCPRKVTYIKAFSKRTEALSSLNFNKTDWNGIQKEILEQDLSTRLSAVVIDIEVKKVYGEYEERMHCSGKGK